MATCLNCKKKLSCGCQQRKATDGKSVCTNCLGTYQAGLKNTRVVPPVADPIWKK